MNVQQPRLTPFWNGQAWTRPNLASITDAALRQSASFVMMFAQVPPAGASITEKVAVVVLVVVLVVVVLVVVLIVNVG
jgi:hypothetical protein